MCLLWLGSSFMMLKILQPLVSSTGVLRLTLLLALGTHFQYRCFPLLPKQRNLTHPIFLNCIIVLITQTRCRRRYKQVSSPPRALPAHLIQHHPRTVPCLH